MDFITALVITALIWIVAAAAIVILTYVSLITLTGKYLFSESDLLHGLANTCAHIKDGGFVLQQQQVNNLRCVLFDCQS